MKSIDLNADLGEGMKDDEALMLCISSANIACGGHAGDINTMRLSVELAMQSQIAIGAHISYPDKNNFGRVDIFDQLDASELRDSLIDQMDSLKKICVRSGATLKHVKPHGALYNRAAFDAEVSAFVCDCISSFDSSLILYGLSGSMMGEAASRSHLIFINEVFSDRSYEEDGSLTPRNIPGSVYEDVEQSVAQALQIVSKGFVITRHKNQIPLKAESICVHGDGKQAVNLARVLVGTLLEEGIKIEPPSQIKI